MQENQQSDFRSMVSTILSDLILEGKISLNPLLKKWSFSTTVTVEGRVISEYGNILYSSPRTYEVTWCPQEGEKPTPLTVETPEGELISIPPAGSLKSYLDYVETYYRVLLTL